jgi:GT2 family glycosyltransferase|tara:strand:+ start:66 stop:932 length:867 start_codon:yes stop_codon:yes gene_type:complete
MTNNIFNELTIVIVAYNSNDLLLKCLDSIKRFNTIIVDNGNNDKIFSKINSNNQNVKIISRNKNLGFPKGINYATEFVKTEYFLILNADTYIDEKSINNLLKTCKEYNNCAAAAPITELNKDGYDLFPENGKGLERNFIQKKTSKILYNLKPDGETCVEVSKLGLMINLKIFLNVGKFSEKFFMFWEEIDLCKKFRNSNFSVIVNPKAKIIHDKQKSSNNDLKTFIIKIYHLELSPLYYFNIKKNSKFLYFRIFKYLFRTFAYFLIFSFKNSFKNFIKTLAIINYILS